MVSAQLHFALAVQWFMELVICRCVVQTLWINTCDERYGAGFSFRSVFFYTLHNCNLHDINLQRPGNRHLRNVCAFFKRTFIASFEVQWTQPKHLPYGGWLRNTGKTAQAINNRIYLLRLLTWQCVFAAYVYSQTHSQVLSIKVHFYTLFSYHCLHFCKCRFAEVRMTFPLSRQVSGKMAICKCKVFPSLGWHVFLLLPIWPFFIIASLI